MTNHIIVNGAKTHNLKNISIEIPKNKLIVFTGVSGSGKSSLAIDTIFAEGQRKYAESLNSYARQFLMRMQKPNVDSIQNLSPAICIDQKVSSNVSARSTVGTLTEIYDYLKLLFARVGETFSPLTNKKIEYFNSQKIQDEILKLKNGEKIYIAYLLQNKNNDNIRQQLENLVQKGFTRILINEKVFEIEEFLNAPNKTKGSEKIFVIVDRFIKKNFDEDEQKQMIDSIDTALFEGHNEMYIIINEKQIINFSNRFEADGIEFIEPQLNLFSFNNSFGACPRCEGHGMAYDVDLDLLIPNTNLSIYDDAIAIWRTDAMSSYKQQLIQHAKQEEISIFKPYKDLDETQKQKILYGTNSFMGLFPFIQDMERQAVYKMHYRIILSKYKRRTTCTYCKGSRLRKEALYVKINNKNIFDLNEMPIQDLQVWFNTLVLSKMNQKISERIILEIKNRLTILLNVGLGYLSLNRNAATLSGGESQRIKLTLSLGSNLTDSIYILDEPSIGLHSRDTEKLIQVLKDLKEMGNTVLVVEHDESIMRAADQIIDIGPLASYQGGEVVAQGTINTIKKNVRSLTAKYLNQELMIQRKKYAPNLKNFVFVEEAYHNNLKNISVKIPTECLCVISGVSGSGKTSLVKHILYPAMDAIINNQSNLNSLSCKSVRFDSNLISNVEMIDQNAMGRSSRSNPISYIGGFDAIREVFAKQGLSKIRGYQSGTFSFNVAGGRCESCEGEGVKTIEMQFLANVKLICENCQGKRYSSPVLEVLYQSKNIAEVLNLSVDEACLLFKNEKKVMPFLQALQTVGLGYVQLGQSSSTLSGGEAQRIKLASYILKGDKEGKQFFIFDEPTTGLHFHDVQKLLTAFNALLDKGHSILVIEHHTEVIKNADWVIEMGPEAGVNGGEIIFEGLPSDLAKNKKSPTAPFL